MKDVKPFEKREMVLYENEFQFRLKLEYAKTNINEIIKSNISQYANKINYITNEFIELASELNVLSAINKDKHHDLLGE